MKLRACDLCGRTCDERLLRNESKLEISRALFAAAMLAIKHYTKEKLDEFFMLPKIRKRLCWAHQEAAWSYWTRTKEVKNMEFTIVTPKLNVISGTKEDLMNINNFLPESPTDEELKDTFAFDEKALDDHKGRVVNLFLGTEAGERSSSTPDPEEQMDVIGPGPARRLRKRQSDLSSSSVATPKISGETNKTPSTPSLKEIMERLTKSNSKSSSPDAVFDDAVEYEIPDQTPGPSGQKRKYPLFPTDGYEAECIVCGKFQDKGSLVRFTEQYGKRKRWVEILEQKVVEKGGKKWIYSKLTTMKKNRKQAYLCKFHFAPDAFDSYGTFIRSNDPLEYDPDHKVNEEVKEEKAEEQDGIEDGEEENSGAERFTVKVAGKSIVMFPAIMDAIRKFYSLNKTDELDVSLSRIDYGALKVGRKTVDEVIEAKVAQARAKKARLERFASDTAVLPPPIKSVQVQSRDESPASTTSRSKSTGSGFKSSPVKSKYPTRCKICRGCKVRSVNYGLKNGQKILECANRNCLATICYTDLEPGTILEHPKSSTKNCGWMMKSPSELLYPSIAKIRSGEIKIGISEVTPFDDRSMDNGHLLIHVPGQRELVRLI